MTTETSLPTTPLWQWDATDIAAGIRSRAISAREALTACFERMDAVNGRINAVVIRLDESAFKAADRADAALAAGEEAGPLHGVPVTIKINIDLAGSATTNGLPALAGCAGFPQLEAGRRRALRPDQCAEPVDALVHRQPAARGDAEPPRPRPQRRRVQRRGGGGAGGRHRALGPWQ